VDNKKIKSAMLHCTFLEPLESDVLYMDGPYPFIQLLLCKELFHQCMSTWRKTMRRVATWCIWTSGAAICWACCATYKGSRCPVVLYLPI